MLLSVPFVFLFLMGLAVGSHVNVLVLRFGFVESASPRSECAQCTARIRWYDLIPVVSYLALSGRCRACGSSISAQYPVVEFATGVLFVLAYLVYPPTIAWLSFIGFFALLAFLATVPAIVAYDIRHTLIPLPFVYFLAGSAVVVRMSQALAMGSWYPLIDATLGAVVIAGFFAAISLISRERGMGMGDAYVAAAIGLLLGLVRGIVGVMLGVWIATAFYLSIMLVSRVRMQGGQGTVTMKTELPFAPWLLLGSLIGLFVHLPSFGFAALFPQPLMVTSPSRFKVLAAFSLVELMVVVSIFGFISTLVLANHSKFNSSVLLESLAYNTALSIRQAQVYGLSVRQSSGASSFQVGYGVHFAKSTPTSYLFFADNNTDKRYDTSPDPADSIVESYTIGQGHTILRFCAYTASGTGDCSDSPTPITYLDISFLRPEPDANFMTSNTGTLYSRATITVTSGSGDTRTISVASTGETSVSNP